MLYSSYVNSFSKQACGINISININCENQSSESRGNIFNKYHWLLVVYDEAGNLALVILENLLAKKLVLY